MEFQSASSTFADIVTGRADARSLRQQHIVDQLIEERGQNLVRHPLWPLIRPALYKVLYYEQAVRMADDVAEMSGIECFEYVSRLLDLDITVEGKENLPKEGGFILVSNHPTGIADGVAVYDMLKDTRPDLVFFANRDAIRVNQRLSEIIIPVEWRTTEKSHAKSRETLVRTSRAFAEKRAIVLFPSGRIAYWSKGRLNERPWQATGVHMAKRYNVPVVPMHMSARNSKLFYLLSHRTPELRDMTVFHELLNKKGQPFRINIGKPVDPGTMDGDVQDLTVRLQRHCEHVLRERPDAEFEG
ncbi:1-acyl-sn-glycerol-3-phosphate acyltransferase [Oricola thermophila]|uniref:1-acyl-sn-glycerol-3-phosphate acyltransferase n=1 Tax=Oricola thermophila TaxID=2742145 RepID=A0A6N1VL84_9HYPH|nr:1-acyl-sn-glycerol-3-phosphate acyltransferase [Oricola thermophila]QKV19979.1 1-acyl-sn-glycerol-3-phosphate acyltransferase [Oricola thermophila]